MNKKILEALEKLVERVARIESTMATKNDLALMEKRLIKKIKDTEDELIRLTETYKADKTDITRLETMVERLERKLSAQ